MLVKEIENEKNKHLYYEKTIFIPVFISSGAAAGRQ